MSDEKTYPIHLTASTTLRSGRESGVNAAALKNPTEDPMEICEIKINLQAVESAYTVGSFIGQPVGMRLDLGKIPLTNGYVPSWVFGKPWNMGNYYYGGATAVGSSSMYGFANYVWRLSKPLYVPGGSVLVPTLKHFGYGIGDINVQISYSGRGYGGKYSPTKVFVPWVCNYTSKALDYTSTAQTDSSNELDLVNIFDQPLRVDRFVGIIGRTTGTDTASPALIQDNADMSGAYLSARIVSSFGEPLVRNFVPFGALFPAVQPSWECEHVMPPRTYYKVYLSKAAATTGSALYTANANVSLVGWREMQRMK